MLIGNAGIDTFLGGASHAPSCWRWWRRTRRSSARGSEAGADRGDRPRRPRPDRAGRPVVAGAPSRGREDVPRAPSEEGSEPLHRVTFLVEFFGRSRGKVAAAAGAGERFLELASLCAWGRTPGVSGLTRRLGRVPATTVAGTPGTVLPTSGFGQAGSATLPMPERTSRRSIGARTRHEPGSDQTCCRCGRRSSGRGRGGGSRRESARSSGQRARDRATPTRRTGRRPAGAPPRRRRRGWTASGSTRCSPRSAAAKLPIDSVTVIRHGQRRARRVVRTVRLGQARRAVRLGAPARAAVGDEVGHLDAARDRPAAARPRPAST